MAKGQYSKDKAKNKAKKAAKSVRFGVKKVLDKDKDMM